MAPLRFSHLKRIAQSPMHYEHGLRVEMADALHLRLGRATDAKLFGGEVIVFPGERRGDKWRQFAEANAGAEIITAKEEPRVTGMVEAIRGRPDAMELLQGERQKRIEWTIAGRACSGTPDAFTDKHITDLKSARSSDPQKFAWEARRLGYLAQLAWYTEGLVQSGRARPSTAYIVAVESTAPHPVTVFELTARALDQGARTWRLWFEQLRACEESNAWPPYAEGIVPLDVPEDDEFSLRIGGEEVEIE